RIATTQVAHSRNALKGDPIAQLRDLHTCDTCVQHHLPAAIETDINSVDIPGRRIHIEIDSRRFAAIQSHGCGQSHIRCAGKAHPRRFTESSSGSLTANSERWILTTDIVNTGW